MRRARLALALFLSLLAVAVAGCFFLGHDETGRIRDRATGEGYRLLEEAKWFHAMGAFREALEIDPDHAPAHCGLGRVFTETGYLEGAEREFLRAVALDPRYGEAYVGLARLYYASGRMEEAEKSIAKAEANGGGDTPEALLLLGLFAERRGSWWDAESRYRSALRAGGTAAVRLALIDLLLRRERYDDALYELEREPFPRGEEEEIRRRLAACRLHLGQDLEAERLYRQLARSDPLAAEPLWALVVLALRRSDPEGARVHLVRLSSLLPPDEAAVARDLAAAIASPDPFFVLLGRLREVRAGGPERLLPWIEMMIAELASEAD